MNILKLPQIEYQIGAFSLLNNYKIQYERNTALIRLEFN